MAFIAFWFFSFFLILSSTMVVVARNPVHSVLYLIVGFFNGAALFLLLGAEFLAMLLVIVYVGAVAVLFLFVVMMLDIKEHSHGASLSTMKMDQALGALRDMVVYILTFAAIFGGTLACMHYLDLWHYGLASLQWQLVAAAGLFFISRFVAAGITRINFFEATRRFLKVIPLHVVLGVVIVGELLVLIFSYHLEPNVSAALSPLRTKGENLLNTHLLGKILYTEYIVPFLLAGFILLVSMVGAIILTLRTREGSRRQSISAQLARNPRNSLDVIDVPIGQGLSFEKEKP